MLRICIFCEKWGSGGIESFLLNVLEHIDYNQYEITIIATKIESLIYLQRLRQCKAHLIELSGNLMCLAKNHKRFRKLLKQKKYDVIHFNIYHALTMCYAAEAKKEGIPCRIVHSHNNCLRPSKTRLLKQILHYVCKYIFIGAATELWACSFSAAKFMFPMKKILCKSVSFVPNGIEIQKFVRNPRTREEVRKRLGFSENCYVIGNVGRLCPQKNQSFLIELFSKIERAAPQCRLLLIGEGADEHILRERAQQLDILDKVVFGGVSECIEALYWSMDVFVFPSLFEGLGIAAIEAQAAGLPTICSDCVPWEAIATSLSSQIALDADTDLWIEKILSFQHTKSAEASMELKERGFDIQDVAQKIEKVYHQEYRSDAIFRPVEGE